LYVVIPQIEDDLAAGCAVTVDDRVIRNPANPNCVTIVISTKRCAPCHLDLWERSSQAAIQIDGR
jgi:hypothetical protein